MIPEDEYKYIVRGKWHARLPAPVPGSPLQRRLPGYRVYGPFFLRESRSRLNGESGSGVRPQHAFAYARIALPAQNPFFAAHCLIRLGGDDWKCGAKNTPRSAARIMCECARPSTDIRILSRYVTIDHIIPNKRLKNNY